MHVRPARAGDGRAVGEVRVASWRAAYRGLMPDQVLDGLSVDEDRWEAAIGSERTDTTLLLVEDDDTAVVGFSLVGPDRDGAEATGEIVAIYLHPDVWDRGYGWALMEHSVTALREHGYRRAVLWVLESNDRARRFYETAAWLADGGRKLETWDGFALPHIRYARDLA